MSYSEEPYEFTASGPLTAAEQAIFAEIAANFAMSTYQPNMATDYTIANGACERTIRGVPLPVEFESVELEVIRAMDINPSLAVLPDSDLGVGVDHPFSLMNASRVLRSISNH